MATKPVEKMPEVAPPAPPAPAMAVAPVMGPNYLKRSLSILLPAAIIAFLIISISVTFGQTDAGTGMGILEGCLILIAGLIVVFFTPIKGFYNRTIGKRIVSRRAAKKATV